MCVHTYIPSLCPLKGTGRPCPGSNEHSQYSDLDFEISFSLKPTMFLGEMADSRVETGKYKMSLEHLVLESSKNDRSWPKDTATSLSGLPPATPGII